jgi:hypothetical protein
VSIRFHRRPWGTAFSPTSNRNLTSVLSSATPPVRILGACNRRESPGSSPAQDDGTALARVAAGRTFVLHGVSDFHYRVQRSARSQEGS